MFSSNGGDKSRYNGLNSAIVNAGGTPLQENGFYWTASNINDDTAYDMNVSVFAYFYDTTKSVECNVRTCLFFNY